LVAPLAAIAGGDERVLVGPDTADDAGVYLLDGNALVATADFITPVCDDPRRFGRVAAANALSDVFAMGGEVLFALNLCCFPEKGVAPEDLEAILIGAAEVVAEAGGALLGGHSVRDDELKFGLAVVGRADPDRLITNAGARPGDRLILTKPLGTGVLINAFKAGKLDAAGLEPALAEMERLNRTAARLAREHGVRGGTDVTGFGFAGHALGIARGSGVTLRVRLADLPVHERFDELRRRRVTTASTRANRAHCAGETELPAGLDETAAEVLFDPQTSGGLLLAVPADAASALLDALQASGHRAAEVGEVELGSPRLVVV
jgi:selenide,water dikinase